MWARILTISRDHWQSNLTIGQQGVDLVVRLRRPGSTSWGGPIFEVPGVFAEPRWRQLRLSIEESRIEITETRYVQNARVNSNQTVLSSQQGEDAGISLTMVPTISASEKNSRCPSGTVTPGASAIVGIRRKEARLMM